VAIALELGWPPEQREQLRIAGLLHDVGKIGVRDSTLRKTSALTAEEREEMRHHPVLGAQLIAGAVPEEIVPWVIGHHERVDGRGYPHGLAGDQIPLGARILAVADTFDAMASSRSYRNALPLRRVLDEVVGSAGSQLDPDVVRAFLMAIARGAVALDHMGPETEPVVAPTADQAPVTLEAEFMVAPTPEGEAVAPPPAPPAAPATALHFPGPAQSHPAAPPPAPTPPSAVADDDSLPAAA
jgi:HD-GYP domain-containing protein (c-di-GMP phosphodiesterase class II)